MTDLSPKARSLIDAARNGLRATDHDRARIEAGLRAQLGAEVIPPENAAAPSHGASWSIIGGVAVGVCVLGALGYLALRPGVSAPAQGSNSAPAASSPRTPPARAELEPRAIVPGPDVAAPSDQPSTLAPRSGDRLAKEVALLSRAIGELRAGDSAAALRVLEEHQRKFPTGKLSEERRSAKAQALCLLGRVREGQAELSHLRAESPAAARAQQVCTEQLERE